MHVAQTELKGKNENPTWYTWALKIFYFITSMNCSLAIDWYVWKSFSKTVWVLESKLRKCTIIWKCVKFRFYNILWIAFQTIKKLPKSTDTFGGGLKKQFQVTARSQSNNYQFTSKQLTLTNNKLLRYATYTFFLLFS